MAAKSDEDSFALGAVDEKISHIQAKLKSYGYGIAVTGQHCEKSVAVAAAFQRHFRPARVDGRLDASTVATLEALMAGLEGDAIV